MAFPINRPRRLRRTETLRRMIRETRLSPDNFIQPFFVCPGRDVKRPVTSMPGVAQLSVDNVRERGARDLCGRRTGDHSVRNSRAQRRDRQRSVE